MRQQDFTLQEKLSMLGRKPAAATTPSGYVEGFDISKWSVITNAAAALQGMTFAIIRARDGIRDDSQWSTNKVLAKQLPYWGAYAFFNPRFLTDEAPSGWTQAQNFLSLTKSSREFDGLSIPLVIDCENSPNFTMPPAVRYLHELKYYVEAMSIPVDQGGLGRKPIIYSSLYFIDGYLEAHIDKPSSTWEAEQNKQWLRDCPLWIARPGTGTVPASLPKAWKVSAFWQYKLDNTAHPGLSVCDNNRWPGSVAQLAAWCANKDAPIPAWGTVTPPPPPPPVDPTDPEIIKRLDAIEARLAVVEGKAHSTHTITTG